MYAEYQLFRLSIFSCYFVVFFEVWNFYEILGYWYDFSVICKKNIKMVLWEYESL